MTFDLEKTRLWLDGDVEPERLSMRQTAKKLAHVRIKRDVQCRVLARPERGLVQNKPRGRQVVDQSYPQLPSFRIFVGREVGSGGDVEGDGRSVGRDPDEAICAEADPEHVQADCPLRGKDKRVVARRGRSDHGP